MKKSIIVIALLLFSGFAYSQTTVTLQDQCNCEVLSGTAVSSAGAVTPGGADTGDIYVNTNTGTIYFWDGDSWELTSTDDQQLTGFTFNGATNELTLTLENGGNVSVDLSSLSDTLTDTNTTITSFAIDATNTNLVITDSDTNTFSVALADIAALVDMDTQYTAGDGLNLDSSNEFTAVASPDANNALDVRTNGIYVADDQDATEVSLNGAIDIDGDGTGETTVQEALAEVAVELAADGDTDSTNEQITAFGINGTDLRITEAGTDFDVPLSSLGSDDQDATEVSLNGAIDIDGDGTGETTVQEALAEVAVELAADGDTDSTNEHNTAFGINGTNLRITDGGGNLDVPLSSLGSDDQDATEVSLNGAIDIDGDGTGETTVQEALAEVAVELAADGDTDSTNEHNTAFGINGTNLRITDGGGNLDVPLSSLGSDDQDATEVSLNGAIDIDGDGTGETTVQEALAEVAVELAADGDTDSTNEHNTAFGINGTNLRITDGGGNLDVPLSSLGSDDQDATEVSLNGAIDIDGDGTGETTVQEALAEVAVELAADGDTDSTNEQITAFGINGTDLRITEAGTDFDVPLSSLGSDDQDATEVSLNGAIDIDGDGTGETTVQEALAEVAVELAADGDTDSTNEHNTAFGINGTNLRITDGGGNLDVPLSSLGSDDQDATEVSLNGAIDIDGDGTGETTVQEALAEVAVELAADGDTDSTNEHNTAFGINGTNLRITDGGGNLDVPLSSLGSDDQDATEVSLNGAIDIDGDGTGETTVQEALAEVAVELAADGDTDSTNEHNTAFGINGTNLRITDGGGNLDVPLSSLGSDDQDATEVSLNGAIDIDGDGTGETTVQEALAEVAVELAADGDTDSTNEHNTAFGINGTNLRITDGGGNLDVPLSSLGSDDQDATEVSLNGAIDIDGDGTGETTVQEALAEVAVELAADGDTDSTNEQITAFGINGTDLRITEAGTDFDVPLSSLGSDDQDATEVSLNGAIDIDGDGTGETTVQEALAEVAVELAADGDTDSTNEHNTAFGINGTNLRITDGGGNLDVPLSSLGSDDQDATEVSLNGAIDIDGDGTGETTVQEALAEVAVELAADGDTDSTNEHNTAFGINGTNLRITDGGGNLDVPLSSLGSDDQDATEVSLNGAIDIDGDGTGETTVQEALAEVAVELAADGDTDSTNEHNTAFGINGTNLRITDGGGNLDVPLSSLGSDDQDATEVSLNGAIDIDGDGTGETTVQEALAEVAVELAADGDTDSTNEHNTAFGINGTNLRITDGGGNLDVPLSSLGSDDQDATEVSLNGAIDIDGDGTGETTVQEALAEVAVELAADGDTDSTNEQITAFGINGTDLRITEAGTDFDVPLSSLGSDDQDATEVSLNGAIDIDGDGTGETTVQEALAEVAVELAADGDTDSTNEHNTAFGINGTNLRITDGGGNLDVPLSSLGSDDQDATEVSLNGAIDIDGDGTGETTVQEALAEVAVELAADGDTDSTNEHNTAFGINGTNLRITDGGGNLDVPLSSLGSDDQDATEVSLNGAIDIDGDGTGETTVQEALAEVAVELAADGDTDSTNEHNTAFGINGTNLRITDGGGNLDVPLSSLGSDDQDATEVSLNGAIDIDGDGTGETTVQEALAEVAVELAADGDTDSTNEHNTAFGINGTNLRITDGGGNLDVPLSSLGSDDQDATEVSLNGAIDIDGDGTGETTVQEALAEVAVELAADGDTDSTNEHNTAFGINGTNLRITDGGGNLDVPLSSLGSDDQDATEVSLNGAIDIDGDGTGETTVQEALAEVAVELAADGDTDSTNEHNTAFGINGTNLRITDGGGNLDVPLSSLGSDDQDATEVSLNGAIDIDGDGTGETTVQEALAEVAVELAADGDTDSTNEHNTAFGINGTNLRITDGGGNLDVPLSSLGSDDQDATEVSLNGAIDIDGDGTGETTVQEALAEVAVELAADGDTDSTNEQITAFGINGTDLRITEAGTDFDVPLSSLGSDDQDATEVSLNGAIDIDGDGTGETTVQEALAEVAVELAADGDTDSTNEHNTAFGINGTNLRITDGGGNLDVPLSSLGSDDQDATEVSLNGAIDIDGDGTGETTVQEALAEVAVELAADGDTDSTNEHNTAFGINGTNLRITDGGGNLDVPLSSLGSDDQDATEVSLNGAIDIDGDGTGETTVQEALAEVAVELAADGDTDSTNEHNTAFGINGTNLRITDGGGNLDVPLSSLGSDDQDATEVSLNGAIDIDGDGTGETTVQEALAEVAVELAADGDTDSTNEHNTAFGINGTNLRITDGGGNLDVPLSSLGSDDQDATEVSLNGAIDIDGDGTGETTVQEALAEVAVELAADGDTDSTNEHNTAFGINGTNLRITDGGGNLDVPLSSLGSDDQDATEVSLNGAIDIDGDGTGETTVQEALAEVAVELAADGDTDSTNEHNTAFGINGTNLRITDGGGNLDVPLSSLGSDDQDATEVSLNGAIDIDGDGTGETTVQEALAEVAVELAADGDTDSTNEHNTAFGINGTNLRITDGGGNLDVPLSSLGSDDQDATEVSLNGAIDIDGDGTGETTVQEALAEVAVELAADGDTDSTNEHNTAFGINGTNLRITDGGGNLDVPLSSLGSDDQTASEVNITDAGNNFTTDNVEAALTQLANSSTSIYSANGTLTGSRTLSGGSNSLIFSGINGLQFSSTTFQGFATGAVQLGSTGSTTQISGVLGIQLQHNTTVQANLTVDGSYNDSSGDAGTSGQILSSTATGTNWIDAPITDDDVSVTNTVAGNRIATISETGITAVDINETVTSLSQNTTTGVISYTDEDGGTPETANVVSATNADNELLVGTDGGASFEMTDTDVDGDGALETTVNEAIADITKITATAGRVFYPPSIAVPASSVGAGTPIDLHAQYVAQFGTPAVSSPSAPAAIPTYTANELHYYITYYDTSVFSGVTVSDTGVMNFTVDAVPTDYNSLINVVFVVK